MTAVCSSQLIRDYGSQSSTIRTRRQLFPLHVFTIPEPGFSPVPDLPEAQLFAPRLSKRRERKPPCFTYQTNETCLQLPELNVRAYRIFEKFIDQIESGAKTVESRLVKRISLPLRNGDRIYFHNFIKGVVCEITRITEYPDVDTMLQQENIAQLFPQLAEEQLSQEETKNKARILFHRFYINSGDPDRRVCSLGLKFLRPAPPSEFQHS